jgi:hypothetical protein
MKNLIDVFWKICVFKLKPQDLPASGFLMLVSVVAYALASVLVSLMSLAPGVALLAALFDVALMGAMTQTLLWIRELGPRFQQTFTALMGTGAILGFLALPLLFVQMLLGEEGAMVPTILMLALTFWNLAIVGHILRHAITAPFFVGALLAVLYMYVSISIMRSLFATAS